MKTYKKSQLQALDKHQLITMVLDLQRYNTDCMRLANAVNGYLLGINQTKKHFERVEKRIKEIREIGIGMIL